MILTILFSSFHVSDACVAEMDGNDCYVYKGEMTVLHDGSSSEEVVKDDVLASVEGSPSLLSPQSHVLQKKPAINALSFRET